MGSRLDKRKKAAPNACGESPIGLCKFAEISGPDPVSARLNLKDPGIPPVKEHQ